MQAVWFSRANGLLPSLSLGDKKFERSETKPQPKYKSLGKQIHIYILLLFLKLVEVRNCTFEGKYTSLINLSKNIHALN